MIHISFLFFFHPLEIDDSTLHVFIDTAHTFIVV